MLIRRLALTLLAGLALVVAPATAKTSHHGWPTINGMLLINKNDQSRPLDARVGEDPFDGADSHYRCDGEHSSQACLVGDATCSETVRQGTCSGSWTIKATAHHHELLGGHGSDTVHAGPNGDVIWGDYKGSGQGTAQRDVLVGGAGRDFIYASHGRNTIDAGAGNDWLKAHFGRGTIDCGSGQDLLYISRRAQKGYTIKNCEKISHHALGY